MIIIRLTLCSEATPPCVSCWMQAHGRGLRVILDGVFNHASRGFWAFHHILENGLNSPYLDWFIIRGWPLRAYSSDATHPPNYDCWWGLPALPKFNIRNPGVREYLLEVARHWIAFGIDGWRLDVPSEIDDERFWQAFRQVVKTANPEAYLCGEIWHPAETLVAGGSVRCGDELSLQSCRVGLVRGADVGAGRPAGQLPVSALDGRGVRPPDRRAL